MKAAEPTGARARLRELGFHPVEPYKNAHTPWAVRCLLCGATTSLTWSNAQRRRRVGCNECSGSRRREDAAIAIMNQHGLEPVGAYTGANTPWPSRCQRCGQFVAPTLSNIRRGKSGCAYCSAKRVTDAQLESVLVERRLVQLERFPGASRPWKCRCLVCGRVVSPRWDNLTAITDGAPRQGCGFCSRGSRPKSECVEEFESFGFIPAADFPGTNLPWEATCRTCSALCRPTLNNLRRGQGGCAKCAKSGFDRSSPASVYLVTSAAFFSIKVGVAQSDRTTGRLREHARCGWTPLTVEEVPTGWAAEQIERSIVDRWRSSGLPSSVQAADMPQGGWTETAALMTLDPEVEARHLRTLADEHRTGHRVPGS